MIYMPKKIVFIAFTTFFTLVFGHLAILLIIDPLSIGSRGIKSEEFYIKEMRFQSAGIINNIDFDSAIVGTSMAENFDINEASKILGGKFVNLSTSGSILKERKIILDYLLNKKKIKKLIISLDGATKHQRHKGAPVDAWSILYNNNPFDDMIVYTNNKYFPYVNCLDFFDNSLWLFDNCPKSKIVTDLNNLTPWGNSPKTLLLFGGLDSWLSHRNATQNSLDAIKNAGNLIKTNKSLRAKENDYNLADYNEFKKNIVPIIIKNPKIKFIFFFPPYSLVSYAIDYQVRPTNFHQYKDFIRNVVLESEKYKNVELYWFNNKDIIDDLANYKDLKHYHPKFNSFFLRAFSKKEFVINVDNYKSLIQSLEVKVSNYNLLEISDKI